LPRRIETVEDELALGAGRVAAPREEVDGPGAIDAQEHAFPGGDIDAIEIAGVDGQRRDRIVFGRHDGRESPRRAVVVAADQPTAAALQRIDAHRRRPRERERANQLEFTQRLTDRGVDHATIGRAKEAARWTLRQHDAMARGVQVGLSATHAPRRRCIQRTVADELAEVGIEATCLPVHDERTDGPGRRTG
jgi:hypothetical protein